MMILNHLRRLFARVMRRREPSVVRLCPPGDPVGDVLLSYMVAPFLQPPDRDLPPTHTNQWECREIAYTFLERGFAVDVINWDNHTFQPHRQYSVFIDIHSNMARLASRMKPSCLKVLHATGSHWLFQNQAEYSRLLELQRRRGRTLQPRRIVPCSFAIEHADVGVVLGNDATLGTFQYAGKPLYSLSVSAAATHPYITKDFGSKRPTFLWLGGAGMVHKGLDLVLEAFALMPEYQLLICGPIEQEHDFVETYHRELYETPNIRMHGWIDVTSDEFKALAAQCLALVYPSCSEGQAGSVIACMHGGIIPIVSAQSGVDVEDCGIRLEVCTVQTIQSSVRDLAGRPAMELAEMSINAWKRANAHHTRKQFKSAYREVVASLLGPNYQDAVS